MKFVVAKTELLDMIGFIQNAVSQKPSIPILANVLLEAKGSELIMTATDLTVGVRCRSEAKVIEEGATALPARRFFQLMRELTAPHVELSSNKSEISTLIAGSSQFVLNGAAPFEFPDLPDLSGAEHCTISQTSLKEALYRTAFAVSKEDTRYALTGILLEISNGHVTFVGTDGKRLARVIQQKVRVNTDFRGSYILPIKAVDEILKLGTKDEEATLCLLQDKIAVETPRVTIVTKLLSGDFPDVTRVIPEKSQFQVGLHREELASLLRQVSLFTTDTTQSVRFAFAPGTLTLTANHAEIGNGKVNMPVNYQGKPLQIAFNPSYFLDILRHSKDEAVNLEITDSFNPGVITDTSSALCVIMPMRLQDPIS